MIVNWKHELCVAIVAEWVYHHYAYDLPVNDGGFTRRVAAVVPTFRADVEHLLGGPIQWFARYKPLPDGSVLRLELNYQPVLDESVTRLRRFCLGVKKET